MLECRLMRLSVELVFNIARAKFKLRNNLGDLPGLLDGIKK